MKTNPIYPTPFEQKVLSLETLDEKPVEVNLIIPSLAKPGIPFELKAVVYDENGFPAVSCDATLQIKCEQDDSLQFEIPFVKGCPATAKLENVVLKNEGFHRFETKFAKKTFFSNPTYCSTSNKNNIYWGDPHIHTTLSNCHAVKCRSLNFCFAAAKNSTGLDWAAAADHVSNGRCELARWKEQKAIANQFNEPPSFLTLPAYEASLKGGCGGDNNVYMVDFPDIFVDEYEEGNLKTLVEKIEEKIPASDFIAVPHHTSRDNKHGEIPDKIYPGEAMMPVVEIHSKWGTSEYRGNPNPLKVPHTGPSYVSDFLKRGMILGFIGGTDSHATLTTARNTPYNQEVEPPHIEAFPGMTAVISEKLDRKGIIKAFKGRQCYAVSGDRILITGDVNGEAFGNKIKNPASPVKIQALIAGKADIAKVEIVRNGKVIHTESPDDWNMKLEYSDNDDLKNIALSSKYIDDFVYYYIRLTCKNGAQAWSSPVWLFI